MQASSDDNTLVNGVAGDPDGLGYFGYAYFAANKDKLRAVAVQNGPTPSRCCPAPPRSPTRRTLRSRDPLYIYVKNSAARRPEVAKFLKFYIEKIDELAVKGGYDPPTAQDKTDQSRDAREVALGRRQ